MLKKTSALIFEEICLNVSFWYKHFQQNDLFMLFNPPSIGYFQKYPLDGAKKKEFW